MIPTFKLEEYLGRYEFSAPHMLCASDAESFSASEILSLANEQELQMWQDLRLGYTEVQGLPVLRKQIAKSIYPGLKSENISCFAGAEDGIFCTLSSLIQKQDHVIVLTPCYQSLMEIPKSTGCEVTEIPLLEKDDWRIDLNAIKDAIRPNTKWMVMNFPHNPTGQTLRQDELEALVKILEPRGIWLFSDEAYRLLGEANAVWSMPAACVYDKAISLGVMSKAYGMAGLRVGWIACQNKDALLKITEMKHYTSICNSALSEIVSLIALRNSGHILARNNAIVTENMMHLDAFLKRHEHLFSWVRPTGGCVGFVRYHGQQNADDFCEYVRESQGILLLPGSVYHVNTPHFRIGFGRATMKKALSLFEKAITKDRLQYSQ